MTYKTFIAAVTSAAIALVAGSVTASASEWVSVGDGVDETGSYEVYWFIEGERVHLKLVYENGQEENEFVDVDCEERTVNQGIFAQPYLDLPPGSHGRQAIDEVCGE